MVSCLPFRVPVFPGWRYIPGEEKKQNIVIPKVVNNTLTPLLEVVTFSRLGIPKIFGQRYLFQGEAMEDLWKVQSLDYRLASMAERAEYDRLVKKFHQEEERDNLKNLLYGGSGLTLPQAGKEK